MAERYLVLRKELIAASAPISDEEHALGEATTKVQGDREPRVVVKVIAELNAEPVPNVVQTRFDK